LAGIAVECALKAVIAKQTKRYEFPDRKRATESFEHDPHKLLKLSGLEPQFNAEAAASPAFALNWTVVKDWGVNSRYDHTVSEPKARDMLSAVAARRHGVFQWLRRHW
jgi:hypothetical protein